MVDQAIPSGVLMAGDWIRSLTAVTDVVGKRVSHKLATTYPAIRLTDVGPIERGPEEHLRRIQVECWAEDYFVAEQLAAAIEAHVDEARGDWPEGYCAGASIESGPFANPDPNSQRYRHQLDVALWIYPS